MSNTIKDYENKTIFYYTHILKKKFLTITVQYYCNNKVVKTIKLRETTGEGVNSIA